MNEASPSESAKPKQGWLRLLKRVYPYFGILLFFAALLVLGRSASTFRIHDVLRFMDELPAGRLVGAAALVVVNLFLFAVHGLLALRPVRRRLPLDKVAFTAMLGFAFSNVVGGKEKGFSLGWFDEDYLNNFPVAVVRDTTGRIVAFANLWPGDGRSEVSIDLMRYLPDLPNGIMDYLFIGLFLWGRDQGYAEFNLGMAPLAGLEDHPLSPLWTRIGVWIFRHGEHFYNFEGLRRYKEKFNPQWRPRYLASIGNTQLPNELFNITLLIAGGLRNPLKHGKEG